MSTSLAAYAITGGSRVLPALTTDLANPESWLLLVLTKISSLCALAMYTHVEVQAAVKLFENLRDARHPWINARPFVGMLIVPLLQLAVAAYTLLVQGTLFQTSTEAIGTNTVQYVNLLDVVLASVGLTFILQIDDQAWTMIQPLL
jgi:magnesium-transporting ATPase (P-type)